MCVMHRAVTNLGKYTYYYNFIMLYILYYAYLNFRVHAGFYDVRFYFVKSTVLLLEQGDVVYCEH